MKDFEHIIACYLQKQPCEIPLTEEITQLSLAHGLGAMLYPLYKTPETKRIYISTAITQEKFKRVQEETSLILNQNKIKHLYVKGTILHQLYDDPVLRTRGDIDLYVSIEDFETTKELLQSNGFQEDHKVDCMHHIGLIKDGLEVELHFSLFDDYANDPVAKLFKNPFEYSDLIKEYEYSLNPTYHFIYCVCHFANHLRMGCGLRYIFDFYYMLSKTEIDYSLLNQELKKLKLEVLYKNILNAIEYFTNKEFDSFDKIDIEFFIEYLESSGIHGFLNKDPKEFVYLRKNSFRWALSQVFMTNKDYRLSLYPTLGKYWIFYPFIWIHHILYLIFIRFGRKIFKKLAKFFSTMFHKDKKKKELYKKLGI